MTDTIRPALCALVGTANSVVHLIARHAIQVRLYGG